MKFYFLGTGSSYPTVHRGVSSMALQLNDGSYCLFDCGEGTQIQLQKVPFSGRKIKKIFITHLHGDHLFGLSGLLCTISSQIGVTNEKPEKTKTLIPILDICGPLGLRKFIHTTLSLSRSPLMMKIRIHELEPIDCQYPADWNEWPVDHSSPPSLIPSEEPGRIITHSRDENGNVSWDIFDDDLHCVTAGFIHHRIPCFGFVIEEKDRLGTLEVDKLKSFGLKPGPLYGRLKSGHCITLEDGRIVRPDDVTGPLIRGRTVLVYGDTSDAGPVAHLVRNKGCDVLVHESTFDDSLVDKAQEYGHSSASMAAEFAKRIGVKILLLNHFSQRYSDLKDKEDSLELILNQAKKTLEGTGAEVHCTHDLFFFNLDRAKRGEELEV